MPSDEPDAGASSAAPAGPFARPPGGGHAAGSGTAAGGEAATVAGDVPAGPGPPGVGGTGAGGPSGTGVAAPAEGAGEPARARLTGLRGSERAGGTSWRQATPLEPRQAPVTGTGAHDFADEGVPLDADAVIVAAGAWTGEVCRPLGVKLPVFPRRGQILHVTLEGIDTAWWPIVLPRIGPYLLGFPDSRVVIGATIEDVGFSPRVTMGGLGEVIEAGLQVAPGLVGATVAETRVGLRPVYAPGSPLIGRLTSRVVVATGLSSYGLTAGPFTGRIAAALALGDEPPIDVTPYAPALA
ncbi:FAD-dependent oxidoreductase [Nonomuraea longispora]|uniref:FAD-dependent oxidoreductase n=1 Tax=Nonomuraea longispora TaxID=1848320 RepID=A0A4R4MAI6_9ACTN|nr:FAD-dependent oxidoreductase [Nonomuraea longispora]